MTRFFISALALLACTTAFAAGNNDLLRPMPDSWEFTEYQPQELPSEDQWWLQLDDSVLDSLITMGENANFDLEMAARRMDAAARQMDVARAAYFPTIGVNAGYTRTRAERVTTNRYAAQATLSWEIDLFGKITSHVRQKKAQYRASRAQWVGAMVSMAGEIASTYVQMRVWQAQLAVAEEHVATQDSISKLVEARYESGLDAKPQLEQSLSILHSTRATIPGLRSSIGTAISSIALLVGRYPNEIEHLLRHNTGLPEFRQLISAGVPAELLRRRPDIVAAEQTLAAAAAAVGIAKKDFLPSLTLTADIGFAGPKLNDTFNRNGFGYTIAPTLSWTLFDGMARRAGVIAARDEMEAQIANYNYTVMNAYNEVDNAILAYHNDMKAIADYELAYEHARSFLTFELDLYTQGLAPYSDVATAEQDLLNYANSVLTARGNALTSLVTLYKALGGGFSEVKF